MSDAWSYDPGYLPGDPRYGLSPAELDRFYKTSPTLWMIRSTYGPDALEKRPGANPAHTAHLRAHKRELHFAGPFLADDGKTPTGSFAIFEGPNRAAPEQFMATEGFNLAGMFSSIEIKRFVETSPEQRRQVNLTQDPSRQLFVCELIDGPDGAEIRKRTGPAHHRYQQGLIDRFLAHGPLRSDDSSRVIGTLYIIAVENRAAAEAFIAEEPMTRAGVFSEIRIDRWRFGNAISPGSAG